VIEEDKMVSFQNNTNMETVSSCEKIPMEVLCEPKNICKVRGPIVGWTEAAE
jgi:protein SSX1